MCTRESINVPMNKKNTHGLVTFLLYHLSMLQTIQWIWKDVRSLKLFELSPWWSMVGLHCSLFLQLWKCRGSFCLFAIIVNNTFMSMDKFNSLWTMRFCVSTLNIARYKSYAIIIPKVAGDCTWLVARCTISLVITDILVWLCCPKFSLSKLQHHL